MELNKLKRTVPCERCGCAFETEPLVMFSRIIYQEKHCDACAEIVRRELDEKYAAEKREAGLRLREDRLRRVGSYFSRVCPARYAATCTEHPEFNEKLWLRVAEWQPEEDRPWLGLVGPSGRSKTRIAYLLARKLMEKEAREGGRRFFTDAEMVKPEACVWLTDYSFREAAVGRFSEGAAEAVKLLGMAKSACLLVFDDLGKAKPTPAVANELFALIDHRHAQNLPMIWTSNLLPEEWFPGVEESVAVPLRGRLTELSQTIVMGRKVGL